VDALVSRFKYSSALHYGALLGRVLGEHCRARRPDGIVPVPLHPTRLVERGFNQAQELARPIATTIGVPIRADLCARIAPTPPQAGLPASYRRRDLQDAFTASPRARGLRLAVIDDVMTTGSTARALTLKLLRAGAKSVEVWAVARGGAAQGEVNV
jgi:ComF family protein